MTLDIDHLRSWIGRHETVEDVVTSGPVRALSATLDRDDVPSRTGEPLPPLWHWLYFLSADKNSDLAVDGHTKRGGFLPPVTLPRRMWAGGRLQFIRPIRIGATIRRTSRVENVSCKEGRTGSLVFVVVRHEIADADGPFVVEEHDIVYRDHAQPGAAVSSLRAARTDAVWRRTVHANEVMLFRYSALLFNANRIHYDRRYVTEVEGYPGLIVHGPLIATLLAELVRDHTPASMTAFRFRAIQPTFDCVDFEVCGMPEVAGKKVTLWARNTDGSLAMEAEADLASF